MRRVSSKRLGSKRNRSDKGDGGTTFNSMKYMYLSCKVARNVVPELAKSIEEKLTLQFT